MRDCAKTFLKKKGYAVNTDAFAVIKRCDDWYKARTLDDFHNRKTVQGIPYTLHKLGFAKRCCTDDANLCEVVEINVGDDEAVNEGVNDIFQANRFDTMFREQLEMVSACGTAAAFIRMEGADAMDDGTVRGGRIRINYCDADSYLPLTVENKEVLEAAFSSTYLRNGKEETVLVIVTKPEERYIMETHIFDETGKERTERAQTVTLGEVKPFAVIRNAEVNNYEKMDGYGLPKIDAAIPYFKALELTYNVLYGDLDKGEKMVIVNDLLCGFDKKGQPIPPSQQAKKTFVMIGQTIDEGNLLHEVNPEIRAETLTRTFELILSLLSMSFGYGTKKYRFENGQITTATEYVGERQDQMQSLNRQRAEAEEYISDLVRAIIWFSNTFSGSEWDVDSEVKVDFDDSYINNKEVELERRRNDALSFGIPEIIEWYLMDAYNLTEEDAKKLLGQMDQTREGEDLEDDLHE